MGRRRRQHAIRPTPGNRSLDTRGRVSSLAAGDRSSALGELMQPTKRLTMHQAIEVLCASIQTSRCQSSQAMRAPEPGPAVADAGSSGVILGHYIYEHHYYKGPAEFRASRRFCDDLRDGGQCRPATAGCPGHTNPRSRRSSVQVRVCSRTRVVADVSFQGTATARCAGVARSGAHRALRSRRARLESARSADLVTVAGDPAWAGALLRGQSRTLFLASAGGP